MMLLAVALITTGVALAVLAAVAWRAQDLDRRLEARRRDALARADAALDRDDARVRMARIALEQPPGPLIPTPPEEPPR